MQKKIAIILGIFLILPFAAQAQISIEPNAKCPDKCENGALYLKGIFDEKTKICSYSTIPCKFGCANSKISTKPECALYPATLPDNETQARDIIFQIVRDMYEKNKVFGHISIFGTEYIYGQNGTLFLKLLDSNQLPINNGFCSINVYYPNKTLKFMDNSALLFLENGLYYKDFFIPNTEGLYIADASCIYSDTVYRFSIPSEDAGYDGNIGGGTSPQPLTFRDIDCTEFHTLGGGTYQNWTFNYTSLGLINLSAITSIDINWVGQISASGGFVQIYDWNDSIWDSLGASIPSTGITLSCGNNVYLSRSRSLNFTSYIRNNTIKMRLFRSGTATMLTDAVEIIFHNNGSVVASLRGSSEVHVNNFYNITSNLTVNLNQSQFDSIISAIASVNQTLNTTILNYLITINGTTYQINQTLNDKFQEVLDFLVSINTTLNTTLEYKLDLINNTVNQINESQYTYYISLLNAINSVNDSLNSSILNYLMVINDTTYQINSTQFIYYTDILQAINNTNTSQFQQYLDLLNLLYQINATGNTTLEFVASINQSLLQYYNDIYVILTDINYTTNTTLENKIDFINGTTWQTWLLLQNLTIGNVSVSADVNWTEGYIETTFLTFSDQINGEEIELFTETLTCLSNTTLQHYFNGSKWVNGVWYAYNETATEVCSWGCANNQCIPAPQFQYFYAFGFVLLVIAVIYIGWQATKKP